MLIRNGAINVIFFFFFCFEGEKQLEETVGSLFATSGMLNRLHSRDITAF